MKIIQLLAATDGESPGTIGSTVFGLCDGGAVWELVSPRKPVTVGQLSPRYYDGETGGWRLVAQSHERTETIPNPDRPSTKL
jgi:hypothetical protein